MNKRTLQIVMGIVLGVMVALIATFRNVLPGFRSTGDASSDTALLLPDPFPAPALELRDTEGRAWSLSSLKGAVVAVFFGYTNCPDVCPITLGRLGRLQDEDVLEGPSLEVVFVSLDPARDTPERLSQFVAGLPGSVAAVTGETEEVRAQAGAFGVMTMERRDPALPAGEYLVDHTARTFILDPSGRMVATLPPMASPEEIREVLGAVYASLRP